MSARPSRLELISHCAACVNRSAPFPFEGNEHTERGKDLHKRTASGLRGGPAGYDADLDGLSDEDAQYVRECWKVAENLKPKGEHETLIEEKLDLTFLGMESGTPDLLYFDKASGTIAVIDWKFGQGLVPDPIENKQLLAYAIAYGERIKGQYKQVYLAVCQPCGDPDKNFRSAVIQAQEMPGWAENINAWVAECKKPNAPATPGKWCAKEFCEARKHDGACPEYQTYRELFNAERKEEKVEQAIAAVSGFDPIVVDGIKGPIVILDSSVIQRAREYQEWSEGFEVKDRDTATRASALLQEITKFRGQVETARKSVKAPVIELGRRIDGEAEKALAPLWGASDTLKKSLADWSDKEEANRAKRLKDAEKKIEEEIAKNNDESHEKALAAIVAEIEPVKIKGLSTKKVPEWEIKDFAAMPDAFKLPNDKAIKAAAEAGTLNDALWIEINWVTKAHATRGR